MHVFQVAFQLPWRVIGHPLLELLMLSSETFSHLCAMQLETLFEKAGRNSICDGTVTLIPNKLLWTDSCLASSTTHFNPMKLLSNRSRRLTRNQAGRTLTSAGGVTSTFKLSANVRVLSALSSNRKHWRIVCWKGIWYFRRQILKVLLPFLSIHVGKFKFYDNLFWGQKWSDALSNYKFGI